MAVDDSDGNDIHDRRLRYRVVLISLTAIIDVNEYMYRQTDRQTDRPKDRQQNKPHVSPRLSLR
jgi:hypothetical protein